MKSIYLDYSATTPLDPRVAEAMHACYLAGEVNPASQHQAGRQASRLLESCREQIASFLGADIAKVGGPRLIFTSGGTESNNLALFGLAGQLPANVVVSSIEHPSVSSAALELERRGFDVRRVPVSPAGVVSVESLERLLDDETRLVSLMLGNNETGAIQPVEQVAALCAARNIPLHCDAVQVIGKLPVDFERLGVTTLSVAPHKFHGPRGIGALVMHGSAVLHPLMFGGQQQLGMRPGTESVALAVGFREAVRWAEAELAERSESLTGLRNRFEQLITNSLPDVVIIAHEAARMPQTSNLAFRGLERQALMMALDLAGIACSTGSSCASGSSEPSPVLLAMGLDESLVEGALRFSFGVPTTTEEVEEAARRIILVVNELRSIKEHRKSDGPSRKLNANRL